MKKFIFVFCILIQSCYSKAITQNPIPDIDINYYAGHHEFNFWRISLHNTDSGLVALRFKPEDQFDFKSDTLEVTLLSKNQIDNLHKFLDKAISLNQEDCPSNSTGIHGLIIRVIPMYFISVQGDCDWDKVDYFYIEKLIFPEFYKERWK